MDISLKWIAISSAISYNKKTKISGRCCRRDRGSGGVQGMMTIEEMNQIREELHLTYQDICFDSGVPISTVQKILGGITKNPRIETMRKLEETLRRKKYLHDSQRNTIAGAQNRSNGTEFYREETRPAGMLRETPSIYGIGGNTARRDAHVWTAAEREALPPERRTELIDGVLYDMASPRLSHQRVIMDIYNQFYECMKLHPSECQVYMSPADVCLDRDEYTMLVPDLFIVCARDKLTEKNVQGAPDFVMEVLSPSTSASDKFIKLRKYCEAGVREYWIVDIKQRIVTVYTAGDDPDGEEDGFHNYTPTLYTFSDHIPVYISDGKCEIDMNLVREDLESFGW